jgi:hypothetical protein
VRRREALGRERRRGVGVPDPVPLVEDSVAPPHPRELRGRDPEPLVGGDEDGASVAGELGEELRAGGAGRGEGGAAAGGGGGGAPLPPPLGAARRRGRVQQHDPQRRRPAPQLAEPLRHHRGRADDEHGTAQQGRRRRRGES